jgi:hypothetical protein
VPRLRHHVPCQGGQSTWLHFSIPTPNIIELLCIAPGIKACRNSSSTKVAVMSFELPPQQSSAPLLSRRQSGSWATAIIATAPIVPILAASATTIAYILSGMQAFDGLPIVGKGHPVSGGAIAVLVGTGSVVIIWLPLCKIYQRLTSVNHADTRSYGLISERFYILWTRLANIHPKTTYQGAICAEIKYLLEQVQQSSNDGDLPWPLGTGYSMLWCLIHKAEEAMIEVDFEENVLEGALEDELKLDGSNISNNSQLLDRLRLAVRSLGGPEYLFKQPPLTTNDGNTSPQVPSGEVRDKQLSPWERATLREIRHAINEYRDERWESLIGLRNQMLMTLSFVGIFTYTLIVLMIILRTPSDNISASALFYLIGALVGLIGRLGSESESDLAIDDYGLASARLIVAPVLSGLAAIGGVLLTGMLQQGILGTNQGSAAGADEILRLSGGTLGPPTVLVAAVFGLTPNLLINNLTAQAAKYKADLRSSETQNPRH